MKKCLCTILLAGSLLSLAFGVFFCVGEVFADDTPAAPVVSEAAKETKCPAVVKPLAEPMQGPISHTDVFLSGKEGYHSYRIPAIVCSKKGTLLAFAEGRKDNRSDSGNIDIVLRRSTDNGKTWLPMQVVANNKKGVAGNPCPVVDTKTGDILLITIRQTPGSTQRSIRDGKKGHRRDYFVQRSSDDGKTWSKPKRIGVTDPLKPRWQAGGPGHALQLKRGEHAGRILVAGNHSTGKDWTTNALHVIYSDDGGHTWKLGAVAPATKTIWPSEALAAELPDGTVCLTVRDQKNAKGAPPTANPATRAFAWSRDGGESFDGPSQLASDVTAPVCHGSILEFSATDQGDAKNDLVVCYPNDAKERKNLCIRCSNDCGKTWSKCRVIYPDSAAYSDLVRTADGGLGVFYERDNYGRITFALIGPPQK